MRTRRSGYAMLLVLVFSVLLLSLYSLAYRSMAGALRIETARALENQRDEGSIRAAARAVALLETGAPPTDPYTCGVAIDTSAGTRSFTVTFATEGSPAMWSVRCEPTLPDQDPPAMPVSFAPAP